MEDWDPPGAFSSDYAPVVQDFQIICNESTSGTEMHFFGSNGFKDSLRHYLTSSSITSQVSIQPGSKEDLSKIVKVLRNRNVPFGVKGGGHSMSPNFSSTEGVQIYMVRFDKVKYNAANQTATVGAGCLWDELYATLGLYGQSIVGGSTNSGVGVAGYLLGGGYSYRTNQHGLGIDNIVEFEVVLPDGSINIANEQQNTELYQCLRGGGNNFGIVTKFTLKTYPITTVYGNLFTFDGSKEDAVKAAVLDFVTNVKDPKAAIEIFFLHTVPGGQDQYQIQVSCFYDGPTPDPDPFQRFTDLGPVKIAGTHRKPKEMSYQALQELLHGAYHNIPITSAPKPSSSDHKIARRPNDSQNPPLPEWSTKNLGELNAKGRFGCVMVTHYTEKLIDAIAQAGRDAAPLLNQHGGQVVRTDIWPFLPTIFDNSPPGAAWPHEEGKPYAPLLVYCLWNEDADDQQWLDSMQQILDYLYGVAHAEGCTAPDAPHYSNCSLETITPKQIWQGNLENLQKMKAKFDPYNLMGNTGGFKIPLPYET